MSKSAEARAIREEWAIGHSTESVSARGKVDARCPPGRRRFSRWVDLPVLTVEEIEPEAEDRPLLG